MSAAQERLPALDLLRGIAILGILPANLPHFLGPDDAPLSTPPLPGLVDKFVYLLTLFFTDLKFITLLSILFGAGLMIQGENARRAGRPFVGSYLRRLAVLFLIGLAHGLLLWFGDILTLYAVVGAIALGLSYVGARWRRWLIIPILLVWPSVFMVGVQFVPEEQPVVAAPAEPASLTPPAGTWQEQLNWYEDNANQVAIYRHGRLRDMVIHRALVMAFLGVLNAVFLGWHVLACFVIGTLLLERGVFHRPADHRPLVRRLILFGLAVGVPLHVAAVVIALRWPQSHLSRACNYWGALPMSLMYLGLGILWSQSGRLEWLQSRFRAVGRLALTNYLTQSVLMGLVFYGYGLGWYGQASRGRGAAVVVAIWVLQLVVSPLWLRIASVGPVEWLWRTLAGRRPAVRPAQ